MKTNTIKHEEENLRKKFRMKTKRVRFLKAFFNLMNSDQESNVSVTLDSSAITFQINLL